MSEEQNCLTFSLTENVRFQKGQEVKELISISLEPNVTCHEFDQYVILQGTLDCVGEYSPVKLEDESEPDFYNVQKCARVTLNDNGKTYNFCYSFPVDITIPADRCRDGEELTVDIHSFEYKIQEDGSIDISCEFCVNGVYDRAFLENEKAEQKQPEEQIEAEVDESQFVSAEPQYGYGQQEFHQPFNDEQDSQFQSNLYQDDQVPQFQDLVRQSPEMADQNQSFEQTILDNTGYHPYYSHPLYGEQDWQRNTQSQWSEWDHPSNINEQTYQVPEQEFQVPREEYKVPIQEYQVPTQEYQVPTQEYQVPTQEYQVPPIEEPETQANYYQTQDFHQPFFQANQHPWQPNQTFNTSKFQQPVDEADPLHQSFYQQSQAEQPVQFQQVEQQQFGDITNFRLNVHGQSDETGYKSIFHDELESPKGPAFDSVESPTSESVMKPVYEKFESPESPASFVAPVFENIAMDDDKPVDVEVFAESSESSEQGRVNDVNAFHAEIPSELDHSYDQVIYPFESEQEPLNENEFYVEVKREPFEYESEYESEQELDESPEYVEFKRDNHDSQNSATEDSSFVSNIFASREERSTCLKICIIQRGDSFEKLAQRYSIHPHKIARFNDLQPNAVLEEGSILYIPN